MDAIDEPLLRNEVLDVLHRDMFVNEVLDNLGDVAHRGVVGDIGHDEVFHPQALFHHGRNHEHEEACQYGTYHDEGTEDAEYSEPHAAPVLEESNQWEQQV